MNSGGHTPAILNHVPNYQRNDDKQLNLLEKTIHWFIVYIEHYRKSTNI